MAIPSDLLCALHALQDADRARAGTKATILAQLAQAGLAVPESVVLYSDAAASVLDGADLGPQSAPAEVLSAELPVDVEAALEAVAERFGDALLAVRSSASAEDLAGASFAGQYETVLNVRGLDELRAAVRRCWASAHAGRVRGYASVHGQAAGSPPAVLIQRQVDADVAGVAFSANPISGARDEALVSAVPGLGDALVSGQRPADEWIVKGDDATAVRVIHQALTEAQAQAIAGLARRIEALLGGPQDVEWAMACGRLLVLQARPVTALPRAPEVHLAPGTWVKEEGRHPEPLTALGASGAARFVADGLTSMWAAYGGLLESMELRAIGGEPYAHVVPVGGHEGSPPPWWVLGLLARVAPPLRRRMAAARRMVRPEVLDGLIERWYSEWRPELQASTARLREVDLAALADDELEVHLGRAIDLTHRALKLHFHLLPPTVLPLYELVQACKRLLGWDTPAALQLLAGTSTATSEPALALAKLGERIRGCPPARAVAERADPDVGRLLAEADPELGAAFAAWCDAYALRCVNNDPGSPLLAERPWLLARLLADAVAGRDDAAPARQERAAAGRAEAAARARGQLASRSAADRERFERTLRAALRAYPVREDTVFWAGSMPAGLIRLTAMEAGRRLVGQGMLGQVQDAVQLTIDELRRALRGDTQDDLRELVGIARAERAWVLQHPGPPFYGLAPSPLPDVRGLPEPGRTLNAALLWVLSEEALRPSAGDAVGHVISGLPGAAGRHTGPVCVVRGEAEFGKLRAGDVLVAPTTDPAWSVLFATAGALVTDGGGALSHAAIVAREHAIPAVVGTGQATRRLRDGDIVTVDGGAGRVILDRSGDAPTPASSGAGPPMPAGQP